MSYQKRNSSDSKTSRPKRKVFIVLNSDVNIPNAQAVCVCDSAGTARGVISKLKLKDAQIITRDYYGEK